MEANHPQPAALYSVLGPGYSVRRVPPVAGLTLLCWLLYFHGLAERDLWSSHEARAAMDAQSLLDDGLGSMPRQFDGRAEVQKPPLYYWLVTLAARATGRTVDTWTVRLPAALAGFVGVLLLYGFGLRQGRPVAGLIAAVVLATAVHFTWLARVGRIDMPLTLTTTMAAAGVLSDVGRRAAPRAAAKRGVGIPRTRGGVATQGADRRRAAARSRRRLAPHQPRMAPPPSPSVCGGASPWWRCSSSPSFCGRIHKPEANSLTPSYGTTTSSAASAAPMCCALHPWWFYAPHFVADFLPWSLLLPAATWAFVRRGWWHDDPTARFGLVWLAAVAADPLCSAAPSAPTTCCRPFRAPPSSWAASRSRWYRGSARPARLATAFAVVVAACVGGWWLYLEHDLRSREPARTSVPFAEAVRRIAPASRGRSSFSAPSARGGGVPRRPAARGVRRMGEPGCLGRRPGAGLCRHAGSGRRRVDEAGTLGPPSKRCCGSRPRPAVGASGALATWLPARLRHDLRGTVPGRRRSRRRPLVLLRTAP